MVGRAWRHPFATIDEANIEGQVSRVTTLDEGLGTSNAAMKQTAAINRILSALEEPRILRARTVKHEQGRLQLISERTDAIMIGEDLAAGPVSPQRALRILLDVCEVLDAAHGLGVIHAALTPASVLVADDGDGPTVRVSDFGLGHVVAGADKTVSIPTWAPTTPETLLGESPGPATDVYLIGSLAHALLTGRPVFEGDSAEVVRRSHAIEEPVALHEVSLPEPIPESLSQVVQRCLVKEPDERFATPGEVAAQLRAFVVEAQPQATPNDASEVVRETEEEFREDERDDDEDAPTRAMVPRDPSELSAADNAPRPDPSRGNRFVAFAAGIVVVAAVGAYAVMQAGV